MNNFSNNILAEEGGIPLKGKTSAKVITHKDTDGLISGITMVHALEKRGIPRDRITIQFAQYGDDDKSYEKFLSKNDSEYVSVTDFAKFPKVKVYDVFQTLLGWPKDGIYKFRTFAKKDFKSMKLDTFKKEFRDNYSPKENKLTDDSLTSLFYGMRTLQDELKSGKSNLSGSSSDLRKLKMITAKPNTVEDHHENSNGSLSGGDNGEIAIHSPSEASHLANKYIPGAWSKEDLEAIDMIDSAGYNYEQLRNALFLEKHFSGKDKKKNLAQIITVLGTQIIKKNPELAAKVVRESGTNLVSVYTHIIQALKIDKKEKALYNALKDGNVELAKQIVKEINDPRLTKNWAGDKKKFEGMGNLNDLDSYRAKNMKDIKKHIKGQYLNDEKYNEIKNIKDDKEKKEAAGNNTSDIISHKNFSIQNIRILKGYPDRYINSLFGENGYMNPYGIKKFPNFVQVSCNPLYKGNVDFSKVAEKVMPEIKQKLLDSGKLSPKDVDKIMETMLEENGGHKAIYSFQGFKQIKAPYNVSGRYYGNRDFLDRAKAVAKSEKEKGTPIPKERMEAITKKARTNFYFASKDMEVYDNLRKEMLQFVANRIIAWTNKLYPVDPKAMEALKVREKTLEREPE
jgi:hypothetical protein